VVKEGRGGESEGLAKEVIGGNGVVGLFEGLEGIEKNVPSGYAILQVRFSCLRTYYTPDIFSLRVSSLR